MIFTGKMQSSRLRQQINVFWYDFDNFSLLSSFKLHTRKWMIHTFSGSNSNIRDEVTFAITSDQKKSKSNFKV